MLHVDAISHAPTESSKPNLKEEIFEFQCKDTEIRNIIRYSATDGRNDPEMAKLNVIDGILYRRDDKDSKHKLLVIP